MSNLKVTNIQSNGTGFNDVVAFQNASGTENGTLCRAWVNFDGTGTVSIRVDFNVSSITDNGTGDYSVNFTNAMEDANYAAVGMGMNESNSQVIVRSTVTATTSSIRVVAQLPNVSVGDPTVVSVAIFR